jgi:protoporphyrinogen IX oxidase
MYLYIKALHIIFIVTWFAGMFYIVRLFIYNREAMDMQDPEKSILNKQFNLMIKRLWFGITWPSAILTLIFGPWTWYYYSHFSLVPWLNVKLLFVIPLFIYHLTLHSIYRQQKNGDFKYSSQHLRIWNEVATIFLVAIVMVATVKETMSWAWGLAGLILFIILLMCAIKVYKLVRGK